MDLLKKELEKKKKAVALAKEQREQSGSKFLKTSELRKIQEETRGTRAHQTQAE